ncbi:hypothetical protein ACFWPA_00355 [Rhodococcus sp. NPDC058505]|uniref:hypothetical protein n=1 Tax=unclassified Rhodococcus (in: high G+C Gram-positive bacteria) TaxID=192944 RepID=UPI00365163D8
MKLTKATVLSVALVAAMGVGAGNSYASEVPTQGAADVGYETSVLPDGRSIATVLDSGAFRLAAGGTAVDVVNDAGTPLTSVPLAYGMGDARVPIAASIGQGGRELTLTPQLPPVSVQPAYSQTAYQNMVTEWEKGWLNGGQLQANTGLAIGLVVGCVLFLFVGCPLGAAIGGTVGAVTGVINANPDFQPAMFEFLNSLP